MGTIIVLKLERTDSSDKCVQIWICSAEPPGEHRHENKNNILNIKKLV